MAGALCVYKMPVINQSHQAFCSWLTALQQGQGLLTSKANNKAPFPSTYTQMHMESLL